MRRRPQPNPRRGLLRAGIAVIVLTVVLFIVIEIISSLTAPPAKAPPVIPPTPAVPLRTPVATPHATVPQATARPTPKATPRTRPTPRATSAPKQDIAFGGTSLADLRPAASSTAPRWVATFAGPGDAYHGKSLLVARGPYGRKVSAGRGDPFVRPVWSPDQSALLFVSVRATHQIPGAAWTLMKYDRAAGRAIRLLKVRAMGLWPLGWRNGAVLYAVSNGSDTSVYTWSRGRSHLLSLLVPQVVSAPSISPDGRFVAFFTPADCSYCSLSVFDLKDLTTWYGPTGVPSEYDVAWTADGRSVATVLSGKLTVIDTNTHDSAQYRRPAGLPLIWPHEMVASTGTAGLTLHDLVTGRVFNSPPSSS